MSIGPFAGINASAAGAPLAQTKGAATERAQQDSQTQQRRLHTEKKAESAAGIGQADGEDHEASDRDADGRRLWEHDEEEIVDEIPQGGSEDTPDRQSRDASGNSGNLLDLSG